MGPGHDDPTQQLAQVLRDLGLQVERERLFRRYLGCNVEMESATPGEVRDRVPPCVLGMELRSRTVRGMMARLPRREHPTGGREVHMGTVVPVFLVMVAVFVAALVRAYRKLSDLTAQNETLRLRVLQLEAQLETPAGPRQHRGQPSGRPE